MAIEERVSQTSMQKQQQPAPPERERINEQIRVPQVQVIDETGTNLGAMPTAQAKTLALEAGVDLVEVSPKSRPPVCKIMDYGKVQYAKQKKQHAARRKQHAVQTKGVRLTPNTEENDLKTKLNQVLKFLSQGNKVVLEVRFKGREVRHADRGREVLETLITGTEDVASVEGKGIELQGKRMIVTLIPGKKQKQKQKKSSAAVA